MSNLPTTPPNTISLVCANDDQPAVDLLGPGLTVTQNSVTGRYTATVGGGSGSPVFPTRGLTLRLQASSDVFADPSTGLATAWGNLAAPGSSAGSQGYWTSQGTTAPAITANINGTPSLTTVHTDAPQYKTPLATTMDYIVGPGAEFSYAGSLKYNGAITLNLASLRTMPLVFGCESNARTWGVVTALDGGGKLRIVVFYTPDDATYYFVESSPLDPTLPHYFVVTYQGSHTLFTGTLNLYVDQLPVVVSAAVPYPTLTNTQLQSPRMFSSAISTNTRQDCDLGEFDAWQVALTPAEVTSALAVLRANGNYP